MFDLHIHTRLSHDSQSEPQKMARRAAFLGLKEICFTDHYDRYGSTHDNLVDPTKYNEIFTEPFCEGVTVRHGIEFGLAPDNTELLSQIQKDFLPFDYVIGSLHRVNLDFGAYSPEFWVNKTAREGFDTYLRELLKRVKVHENYDCLGHMTFALKSPYNPDRRPVYYNDCRDVADEIMKELVSRGKGMEINISGMKMVGEFLPSKDYLVRFKELGGEIVTEGSDAHNTERVGAHCNEAVAVAKEVFGYVCTYSGRKPQFHKL